MQSPVGMAANASPVMMPSDCLYATCTQAGLGPSREDRALIPGNEARPADLYLPRWTAGRDTALDITVVNPLSATYVNQSAATPGYALVKAYERKVTRHGEACRAAGITFQPLPWDTLGGWGNSTSEEVKRWEEHLPGTQGVRRQKSSDT